MSLPPLRLQDVVGHHLLVLPEGVGPDEVETLAVSRFPKAAWETHPTTTAPRHSSSTRGARAGVAPPGVLRLSRLSSLHGPYALDRGTATELGVPTAAREAYVLAAPIERGSPPWPDGGDRDGLARAFPQGLPVRDEERSVRWLVDTARRLAGAVRVERTGSRPAVLVPDPAAAVDLTVWSDIWLEPDAAVAVVRRTLPHARLNLPTTQWAGPPPGLGAEAVPGAEVLTDEQRRALHEEADATDLAALAHPEPMQAYGLLADLEVDGMVAVEIGGETVLPPVMSGVAWAAEGAVAYHVRWEPADLTELEAERPGPAHRVARARATPLVAATARALHAAVGGEVTDPMGFAVDPADL